MSSKNWIAGAIKKPGAEKASAQKDGMSTNAYMEKNKDKSGKPGRRAKLGLLLENMRKK